MKAWMNKLGGVLLASLLTVMLHGKAYAEEKTEAPAVEASTPAAAAAAPDISAAVSETAFSSAAPADSPVTISDGTETAVPAASSANSAAPETEVPEAVSDAPAAAPATQPKNPLGENVNVADTVLPAEPDAVTLFGVLSDADSALMLPSVEPSNSDNPVTLPEGTIVPVPGAPALSVETVQANDPARVFNPAPVMLASSEPVSGTDDGENEGSGDEKGTDDQETATPIFNHDEENDSYVLVNYSGNDHLSADGDLTLMAAGLNHVGAISGSGKVTIAGTGILLVDNLSGELELLTFTDIYDQGSVAVFARQESGEYLLVNGSVPGILDENYTITEDVTLVMPDQTSLLLCGTGAQCMTDGSVEYYHGSDHGCEAINPADLSNIVESTGKLTIAQKAELIIQKGAAIILENLESLGRAILSPELNVTDGGKLTVEEGGTVGQDREDQYGYLHKDGLVAISGEAGTLSGSGNITAGTIRISDPAAINNVSAEDDSVVLGSEITFSAGELELGNDEVSGTVNGLKIKDCKVYIEGNTITVLGLENAGSSTVVLQNASKLDIAKVDGTLHLSQKEYYNQGPQDNNAAMYDDSYANEITGEVSGTGTICFDSGIYKILEGTTLDNGVAISGDFGGLVYDYAGVMPKSESPLHMQPVNAKRADANQGVIPIVAAALHETHEGDGSKTIKVDNDLVNIEITSLSSDKADGKPWSLTDDQLSELKEKITEARPSEYHGVIVEILHKDGDNKLYTSFYTLNTLPSDSLIVDDVCLVRISYVLNAEPVAPAGSAAQTGTTFTGSGILGGSGAGSVNIGPGSTGSNSNGNNDTDTGSDADSDSPTDPEPAPLAAHVEETPDEAALVWVEVAPAVVGESASPENTTYVILALEGEKTLEELGGTATVSMNYTPPAEHIEKPLYVVFRNEDGSLTAIRATFSEITGRLRFITDRLGTFMVVGFEFDGDEFSKEFYEALARLPELKNLIFSEYSPV